MRQIQARLDGVVEGHGVRILHAIESGSRAWGFPSPDSDYDCRFVYCHPLRDYARLRPPRDVIETPLTPVLDVSGWDLRKALDLGLRGNAIVVEWLRSPLVYRGEAGFAERMDALLDDIVPIPLVARHYAGLARRFAPMGRTMPLKKLFYALRPLAALEWLAARDCRALPPMAFGAVLSEIDWPGDAMGEIEKLLERKSRTRELGEGEVPPAIATLLARLPALADRLPPSPTRSGTERARERADDFLLAMLR